MIIDSDDLLARFLRYVQIDTRSDAHSATTPTTPGQWDLLRLLNAFNPSPTESCLSNPPTITSTLAPSDPHSFSTHPFASSNTSARTITTTFSTSPQASNARNP